MFLFFFCKLLFINVFNVFNGAKMLLYINKLSKINNVKDEVKKNCP